MIIDIHASHPFRAYDVDIGTMQGRSLLGNERLVFDLIGYLKAAGLTDISYNRFSADKAGTITKFSALRHVHAMQLEINATYVNPEAGNVEAQRFSKLLQALVRFVKEEDRTLSFELL